MSWSHKDDGLDRSWVFGENTHADVRPAELELSAKELKYKEIGRFTLLPINDLWEL